MDKYYINIYTIFLYYIMIYSFFSRHIIEEVKGVV